MKHYKMIYKPDHSLSNKRGYIAEHRFVASEKWGIGAIKDKYVHHINGNKADNRIENLQIISPSKHQSLHRKERAIKEKDERENKILMSFMISREIKKELGVIAKEKGTSMSSLINITLSELIKKENQ